MLWTEQSLQQSLTMELPTQVSTQVQCAQSWSNCLRYDNIRRWAFTTSSTLALQPNGNRNDCADASCVWTADISNLVRGDSVSYYITAQDVYPGSAGVNQVTSSTVNFDVANPTKHTQLLSGMNTSKQPQVHKMLRVRCR